MLLYFEDLYRALDLVLPSLPPGTRYFVYQFREPLIGDPLIAKTLDGQSK